MIINPIRESSRSTRALFLLFLGIMLTLPSYAIQTFTDTSVKVEGNRIEFFPGHRFADMNVSKASPDVLYLDLPYYSLLHGPEMIVPNHAGIKFVRVSQVNKNPDVVRAAVVFNGEIPTMPVLRDGLLVMDLQAVPQTPVSQSIEKLPVQGRGTILDQCVSLSFVNEDLPTILNAIALQFGLRVFADSGVRGKFSVSAQDMPLRDVLKNLLLQKNFQYTLKGKDLTVISLQTGSGRMARELLFRDLSLKDALQTLSKMMNINMIIHESVEDKNVNFYVENLNLDELLDLLITTSNLVKKPHNENTFIIMAKEESKTFGVKQYRTFKLVNAKPDEVIKTISGSKSLSEKIDTSNMVVNERINALSVYDTAENLNLIAKIIDNIDEKLKQAVIELKLIEINRSSLKQLGISLENYNIQLTDIGRLPSNYSLPATLDFLEKDNCAKVLASPKIRAVHGKQASINIGEVIPVPYFRYEAASSSYLGYMPQTYKEYRDVKVGIRLQVTPEITRDNEISLQLDATVDSVLDINTDGQIHRSERTTTTYVRIKDGETVVLGGLINQQDSNAKQSPSLLNKVPLLKGLLSNTRQDGRESEMIMLVTPRLVNLEDYDTGDSGSAGLFIQKPEIVKQGSYR